MDPARSQKIATGLRALAALSQKIAQRDSGVGRRQVKTTPLIDFLLLPLVDYYQEAFGQLVYGYRKGGDGIVPTIRLEERPVRIARAISCAQEIDEAVPEMLEGNIQFAHLTRHQPTKHMIEAIYSAALYLDLLNSLQMEHAKGNAAVGGVLELIGKADWIVAVRSLKTEASSSQMPGIRHRIAAACGHAIKSFERGDMDDYEMVASLKTLSRYPTRLFPVVIGRPVMLAMTSYARAERPPLELYLHWVDAILGLYGQGDVAAFCQQMELADFSRGHTAEVKALLEMSRSHGVGHAHRAHFALLHGAQKISEQITGIA